MIPAKGYAAPDTKKPLEPFSFNRRAVGPLDVLIDIKFCGICHSGEFSLSDKIHEYPLEDFLHSALCGMLSIKSKRQPLVLFAVQTDGQQHMRKKRSN